VTQPPDENDVDLTWMRDSPFRRPDWRWRLANQLLVEKLPRRAETQDEWVQRILKHLRFTRVVEGSRSRSRAAHDHVLAEASSIRFATDPLIHGELQAWILTGESTAAVAALSGVAEPVVEAFEKCFFDVRPKLTAWSYIIHNAIGPSVYEGFKLNDPVPAWKTIGFFRGKFSLAVTLQTFPGSRQRPWPAWYPASADERAALIRGCRRAILARCLPKDVSSIRQVKLLLQLQAGAEADYDERFGPLGATVPLLSSENMSPVIDVVERDEPVPNPTEASKVTIVATVQQTA
jgi:hypothetical protein